VRAAFIAMRSATCGPPFRHGPLGSNTIARGGSLKRRWGPWWCLSSTSWRPSAASMRPSIALGSRSAMPSATGSDGCQGWPIAAGATGWAGMRASTC
jgi:hypothetical protein